MPNVRHVVVALVLVGAAACKKSDAPRNDQPPPASGSAAEKTRPTDIPGVEFVGDPPKQAADFPKGRWVKTKLFGSDKPYIGFTYVDKTKGNSIKGEDVSGLDDAQIKEKLHAKFPSSTMQPIPAGHPITVLTDEEIKKYELPAEPEWASFYK